MDPGLGLDAHRLGRALSAALGAGEVKACSASLSRRSGLARRSPHLVCLPRDVYSDCKAQQYNTNGRRAAIYARVSDKSQAEDDKASISEQTSDMEVYCERNGLTIVASYQEVGQGWSKKRPEFQRMPADARQGRFDTIVCWKSDRLSRGMYPAAALMEVAETHQIRLEAVMDSIDLKTFGLMAAIGKMELDNFRERTSMGRRGAAKQGRVPSGGIPYGYMIGDDGKPCLEEATAAVLRRIFDQYVHENIGIPAITRRLIDDGPLGNPVERRGMNLTFTAY